MMELYSTTILLCCAALIVLGMLVRENARLSAATKRRFYETYIVIGIAAVADFWAVYLNGAPMNTAPLHALVKCIDYSVSPLAAVLFVRQVFEKNRVDRLLLAVLLTNIVVEVISLFTGWIYYIDELNYYRHGPAHVFYVIVYTVSIVFAAYRFWLYGKGIKKENWPSLLSICLLIFLGIGIQEFGNSSMRTCALGLTLGCILMFIYYSEFRQITSDADIEQKNALLQIDPLTGMLSRYAYNKLLEGYVNKAPEDDLAVFSIDVNGLKNVNDSFGHMAGDELIRGAAGCILNALSPYGKCFRTGGDEFIVVIHSDKNRVENLLKNLQAELTAWKGELIDSISLSCGYVTKDECSKGSIVDMIHLADQKMYQEKALYYHQKELEGEK